MIESLYLASSPRNVYIDVKIEELPQEVYEIELEQTIPGSGAVSAVSGSVLRPGLVIDDPFLIQSIVNSEAAAPDLGEAANTVEEVEEVEEGTVFKENIFVESQNIVAETQDIFVNPSEEQFAAFSGSVEEVPILEYSDYYTVAGGYDYTENGFEDYSDNNNEVEVVEKEVEREPSLHCDLSILLSGISCSFNLLDEDTAPAPAPRPALTPPPLRTPAPTPPPAVVAPWATVQQSLTVTGEQVKEVEEEESEVPFLGLDIEADEDEDDGMEDVTEVADVTKERFSLITNTTTAEATEAGEEDKELRHVVNHLEELHQD